MESDTRQRYNAARSKLDAMRTSTSSAEFAAGMLDFLTLARSILDAVAKKEAGRLGIGRPIRQLIDSIEKEPLVKFFISARNAALKESRYESMRSTVTIEPSMTIRFHFEGGDLLISPVRGIDETKEPEVLEVAVGEERSAEADVPAVVRQQFYFASGDYAGKSVIDLSEQYLARLETVVKRLEFGGQTPSITRTTDTSSSSAR